MSPDKIRVDTLSVSTFKLAQRLLLENNKGGLFGQENYNVETRQKLWQITHGRLQKSYRCSLLIFFSLILIESQV